MGGGLMGRTPFDPAMVLKMDLIVYLYNLTERQVEVYINKNLPAKYSVGWLLIKAHLAILPRLSFGSDW
jgi:hypothetical protein